MAQGCRVYKIHTQKQMNEQIIQSMLDAFREAAQAEEKRIFESGFLSKDDKDIIETEAMRAAAQVLMKQPK
jgi:hypothetical protein